MLSNFSNSHSGVNLTLAAVRSLHLNPGMKRKHRCLESFVLIALLLLSPAVAFGQSVTLHGAGGPTLSDEGYSFAAGIGLLPTPRLMVMANVDTTRLLFRHDEFPGGASHFRGGTFVLASAELRLYARGHDRISPYGLAGFAVGRSWPTVNEEFPTAAASNVRAPFAGGGIHLPLAPRVTFFADLRLTLVVGAESDDVHALAPLRAGLSWRF